MVHTPPPLKTVNLDPTHLSACSGKDKPRFNQQVDQEVCGERTAVLAFAVVFGGAMIAGQTVSTSPTAINEYMARSK